MDLAQLSVSFEADLSALQTAITEGQSLLESFASDATGLTTAEFTGDTSGLDSASSEAEGQLSSFQDAAAGLSAVEFSGDASGLTAATDEAHSGLVSFSEAAAGLDTVQFQGDSSGLVSATQEGEAALSSFQSEAAGMDQVMLTADSSELSGTLNDAIAEMQGFQADADAEGEVVLTADSSGLVDGLTTGRESMAGFTGGAGEAEAGAGALGLAMGGAGERIAETGGHAEEAGGRMEALAASSEGAFSSIEGLAGASGLLALGAAFGITGDEILETNMQFDKTSTALNTLSGDADSTAVHLEEIEKMGLEDGFSIPGLQKASQMLITVGMNADQVVPALQNIAQATTAVGTGQEGIDQVVVALKRMESQGEVTSRTIRAFTNNGIPIYRELADVLGTDVAGAMEAVKNKSVTADEIFQALNENSSRFGDQVDAHAHTFEGAVGRIAASVEALSTTGFRPLYEGMTGLANGIADYLVGIASATSSTDAFTAAFGPLAPIAEGMVAVFDALYNGVITFWSGLDNVTSSLGFLSPAVEVVVGWFERWWPSMEPLVEVLAGPLSAAVVAVTGLIAVGLVAAAASAVLGLSIFGTTLGGLLLPVAAIGLAIGATVELLENSGAVTDWLGEKFSSLGDLIGSAMSSVSSTVSDAFGSVMDTLSDIGSSVLDAFAGLGDDMVQTGVDVVGGLADGLIAGAQAVVDTAVSIANSVIDVFSQVLEIASPSRRMHAAGQFTSEGFHLGMHEGHTGHIDMVRGDVQNVATSVINHPALATLPASGRQHGSGFGEGLHTGISSHHAATQAAAGSLGSAAGQHPAITGLGTSGSLHGGALGSNLHGAITGQHGATQTAAGGLGSAAGQHPAITGLGTSGTTHGTALGSGLAGGVTAGHAPAASAADALGKGVSTHPSLTGLGAAGAGHGAAHGAGLAAGLHGSTAGVHGGAAAHGAAVKGGLGAGAGIGEGADLSALADKEAGGFGDKLKDELTSHIPSVSAAAHALAKGIADGFSSVFDPLVANLQSGGKWNGILGRWLAQETGVNIPAVADWIDRNIRQPLNTFFANFQSGGAWNGILSRWISGIVSEASSGWSNLVAETSAKWQGVKDAIGHALSTAASAVGGFIAPIVSAVTNAWHTVVTVTQTILGPIGTVISYGFLIAEAAVLLAVTIIQDTVLVAFQAIVDFVGPIVDEIGTLISAGWQFVSDTTTTIWTAVQTFLQTWWDWFVGLVTPYVTNIEDLIQTGWQFVSDTTNTIWTAVQTFLQTWWDWLVGLVTPYVQNIETLIQTGWQWISDTTNTIWSAIRDFFTQVWADIKTVFNDTVTGLETFLSDAWTTISTAATDGFHVIAHAIVDPMVDAVNTVMDVISSLGTWLADELDSWGVGASIASALRAGAPTHVANPLPFAEGGVREGGVQSFATGGASIANGTPGYTDQRVVEMGEALAPGEREYYLTESPQYKDRNAGLWAEYGQRMGFARGGMMESFATGGTSPDSVQNIFGGPGNADISQVANTGHGVTINPTHSFSATQSVNQSPSPSGTAASPAGAAGAAGAALPPGTVGLTLPASAWQSAVSDDAAGNAPALGIDLNITNIQTMPAASSSPIGSAGGATVTDPTATTTPVGSSGATPGSTTGTPSAGATSTAGGTTAQATGKWYSTTGITSGMVPTGSLRWMPPPPSTSSTGSGTTGTGATGTTPTTGASATGTGATPTTGAGIGASGTTPGGVAGSSGAGADTVNIAMPTSMWTAVQADEQSGNTPQLLIDFDPSQIQQLDASGTGSTPTGSTGTAPTSTGTSSSAAPSGGSSGGGRSVLSGTNSGTNTLNQTAGSPTSSNFQNVSLTSNTTSQLRRFAAGGFDVGGGEVANPGGLSHAWLWASTPGQHAPIPTYGASNRTGPGPLNRNDPRVKDYYDHVTPKFSFAEGGVFDPSAIQAAQDWANAQAGSDYAFGYAGPANAPGYDCAGIADSVIDVLLGGSATYNKWADTYAYAGGGAGGLTWSDGTGEVSIGVSLNYGSSASDSGDGTHMMINVGGLPVEATTGFGVQSGSTYSGDVTNFDQVMSLSGGTFTPAAGGGGGVSGSALGSALNTGGNAILGDAGTQLAPAGQVGAGLASVVASVGKSVIASVAGKVGGARAGGASPGGAAGTGGASGTDPMSLIAADFPADAVQMADTIMERESGGDPSAYNASGASGLFQIMPSTAEGLGGDPSQLFDPAYNVQLAAQLYAQEGWAPWSETAFADGGIVTSPVLGTIGEGGQDEAVIPLPAGAKDFVEKMSHGSGDTSAIARQLADLKATVEKQHAMDRAHGTHITNTGQLAQMGAASAHAALASDAGKETMDKNLSQSLGFFNNYLGDTV